MARSLGEQVRQRRRSAKMSQEELAYRAGITKNQVQLIEAGRQSGRDTGKPSNPRMSTLVGISEALGVAVSDIVARPDSH